MSDASIYDIDLEQSPAKHTPLSPLSFIRRTAAVFPDHLSVIHGARRFTWAETYERCKRLGSALQKHGVKRTIPLPSWRRTHLKCMNAHSARR